MDSSCYKYGLKVPKAWDEALNMAENARRSCGNEDSHVGALYAALVGDRFDRRQRACRAYRNLYDGPFIILTRCTGAFAMVAAYRSNPPPLRVFCGDDHILPVESGTFFDSYRLSFLFDLPGDRFLRCSVGSVDAYVMSEGDIVLCPILLSPPDGRRALLAQYDGMDLTDFPLDVIMGSVSGVILHELLHTAKVDPPIIDHDVSTYIEPDHHGAYGFVNCWVLAYQDMRAVPPMDRSLTNADSLALLATGLWYVHIFDFSTGQGRVLTQLRQSLPRPRRMARGSLGRSVAGLSAMGSDLSDAALRTLPRLLTAG
ncbi:MAG: hypothetical protein M1817_000040 [Caeruleum heppii]|nr:MAG: hypothetical protein M1817_000040 [Caeruleum heppii]